MTRQIDLSGALREWGTPDFELLLKREIGALDGSRLPLQAGLARSSHVLGRVDGVVILGTVEEPGTLRVRAGLFYPGIVAGCSCADDPTPVDEITEYCEVEIEIDRRTGSARVTLLGQ